MSLSDKYRHSLGNKQREICLNMDLKICIKLFFLWMLNIFVKKLFKLLIYVILTRTKQMGLDYDCHFEHSTKNLRIIGCTLTLILVFCRPNYKKIETLEGKGGQMIFLKDISMAKRWRSVVFSHFTQTDYLSKVYRDPSKITNILPVSQRKGFLFFLSMYSE